MCKGLISVIVPVYGVEKYLHQCVDSILGQTYRNLEVILVDDGSPDRCGEICEEYARQDPRIRVIHKKNGGLSSARNAGLAAMTGDYVAFVDGDDWIEPDTYERMLTRMGQDPVPTVVCCTGIRFPVEERCFDYYPGGTVIPGEEMLRRILLDEVGSQVVVGLYRRACWTDRHFPENRYYEDLATTFKAYIGADRVAFLAESFYHYRTNPASISITPRPIKAYHLFLGFLEHYQYALEHCPEIAGKCCATAAHYAISTYFHYCCERPEELAPTVPHVRGFLKENKALIRENLDHIPGTRRLAIRLYWLSPVLFRVCGRLLHLTGLQSRLGLNAK